MRICLGSICFALLPAFAYALTIPNLSLRDVGPAEESLANLTSKLTTLDNNILAFPTSGGSLVQALNINTLFKDLISTTITSTDQVNRCIGTFGVASHDDALEFIGLATSSGGYRFKILDVMTHMAQKKASFQALPLPTIFTLLRQNLIDYNAASTAYLNALLSGTPATLLTQGNSIATEINTAIAIAVNAYST